MAAVCISSRDSHHPLRVVWDGVKRAEGGATSPLCDTPTERSDEGGRARCRVYCDYVCIKTASRGG